jgi:hypothetical protein
MNLLWSIDTYDWFDLYSDDKKYYKEASDKLAAIIQLIHSEQDLNILNSCLDKIPPRTGGKVREELIRQIKKISE